MANADSRAVRNGCDGTADCTATMHTSWCWFGWWEEPVTYDEEGY